MSEITLLSSEKIEKIIPLLITTVRFWVSWFCR